MPSKTILVIYISII